MIAEPNTCDVSTTASLPLPSLWQPPAQNSLDMSETPSTQPPVLPPELELVIFETAAHGCPPFIPTLMLVSSRVREWVEPLLYRTLIFTANKVSKIVSASLLPTCRVEIFLGVAERRGSEFMRRAVKNVMAVAMSGADIRAILDICSQVENLYVIWGSELLGALERPDGSTVALTSLRHLHAPILELLDVESINFSTHPTFRQLTHLELFDGPFELPKALETYRAVLCIPSLTHLALNGDGEADFDSSQSNIYAELLRDDAGRKLHALVLLTLDGPTPQLTSASDDLRFVVMLLSEYFPDWAAARLYPSEEFWTRVDAVIAERRLTGDSSIQSHLS
ncbi:hypothetical protein MIND_00568700 [Mycena indigotica]|uniref:Uncharacterized protein n=1 Tax=Mycena indigotica TaxID=2126181 RepID=A0A8H6SPE6_9AGAR|nr:uncharacterized protein MIND_00568700 [Mycena indigotica]KAF7303403.1 hypothetical protein MIND_00568700 [Mycena indigotica]